MGFVHLHTRTQYSLLDGAMHPDELCARVAELGMGAVGVTDTCNLYGAVELYKAAKVAKVHPVFGAEVWVWPDGLETLSRETQDGGYHLVLLVEDRKGYQNLCALVTTAIFSGMHYRPRIDLALLDKHKDGLVVLTSGVNGPLARDGARSQVERLAGIVGRDHLFLELQDTGLDAQPAINDTARALARELGLDTVVTNDCRYLRNTDAVTLDLLNAIGRGESLNDASRAGLRTDQHYVKTPEEMAALFPDDLAALARTGEIAERCQFKFKTAPPYFFPATTPPDPDPSVPEGVRRSKGPRADTTTNWAYFYRAFPPPRDFGLPDPDQAIPPMPPGAGSINGYFEWYARSGLALRLRDLPPERHAEYLERLEFELSVIEDMDFPAYLLIVAEFINWAKDHDIPVGPGRGSGAGALVNWALRITDLDPIAFGLLMERFLNPERVSMPDIDVDFCQDRRGEVIEHVRSKYGAPLVSQIITYGKLQAKAALKDVARVCDLKFDESDRLAKLVPGDLGITLEVAEKEDRIKTWMSLDPRIARVWRMAERVEGMCRQTGVHAAGVVIADRPLVEHAPLYRDGADGGPVVQFDMKSAETVGLIKFDFLGLKTLDQLRDAVAMVARNTGEHIDLLRLPFDDKETFELLQKGDGLGIFQVESSGMRELLKELRPSNLEDVIALVALYRPGPLESGMVKNFVECKHGRKQVVYAHPELEPILRATYGSIVYQEQVMQIAQVYAGYSLGSADILRRAMGKKDKREMDLQKETFVVGAIGLGRERKQAEELFDQLAFFAGYGFNKSHSAAYGLISYFTAYLKAHHRAEYMSALMTIDSGNTDKVLLYIGDCRRAGLEILPPDVNESVRGFDVPKNNRKQIRFGLAAVKGVGDGSIEAILEARASGGPFKDLMDCMERIDHRRVNKKALESLVKCGAFDWTRLPRAKIFEGLDAIIGVATDTQADKAAGQASLFGALGGRPRVNLPDVGEWPTAVRLSGEREALGFFISGHPVAAYADILAKVTTCTIRDLEQREPDSEVAVAGMLSAFRVVKTKRGSKMAFATLEDTDASVECIFFSEAFLHSQKVLEADQPILVRGKVERAAGPQREGDSNERRTEGPKILAESAELLSEVRERRTSKVRIVVDAHEIANGQIERLKDILGKSRGSCPVTLSVRFENQGRGDFALSEELKVIADDALLQSLEVLFHRPGVAELA